MGWPRRNSRKGIVDRVGRIWRDASRDWRPHIGKWQPNAAMCGQMKRSIATMRDALDELETKL